jgi:hypothetical protein
LLSIHDVRFVASGLAAQMHSRQEPHEREQMAE